MARYCNITGAAAALLLPLLITLFIITTTVPTAESVSTAAAANSHSSNSGQKCGSGTDCTVADGGGDEEFLMMDSQNSAWILNSLQGTSQNIIYKSIQTGAVCDAKRAGSCIAQAVNPNLNACKDIRNRSCVR